MGMRLACGWLADIHVYRGLLGIEERACNWIVHKISKIPHDKKNTKDSSTI